MKLDELTGEAESTDTLSQTTSVDIVRKAFAGKALTRNESRVLVRRSVEAGRVVAICLFVAALAMFPTGNRLRFTVPIELVVLAAAFLERGVTSYVPLPSPMDGTAGPLLLTAVALVILAIRLRVFVPLRLRKQPA